MTSRRTGRSRAAGRSAARIGGLAIALLAVVPDARAQTPVDTSSIFARFGLDRLRFSGIGAMAGYARPLHILGAPSYSLVTDYGEIAPGYRVVFTATYWNSKFDRRTVRTFADSLRNVVVDPSGDDSLRFGGITVSDISLSGDLRRTLRPRSWFRPYVGGGVAMHLLNADGPLIDGTFVERAIDNLTFGFGGVAGLDVIFFGHLAVDAQARYDLLSLARFGSLRAGATWYFDRARHSSARASGEAR